MKGIDNTLKGIIPYYGTIKKEMKQIQKPRGRGKKKRIRLTKINKENGKPVLCEDVEVSQVIKKLFDYEEIGLSPYEIQVLIEREKALTEQVKKMQDW